MTDLSGTTMESDVDAVVVAGQGTVELSVAELDRVLQLQQSIFTQVATNIDHLVVLNSLCKMAEGLLPNSVASIMLQDQSTGLLSVLCAPSVPQQGIDALKNLQPGAEGGSCGNAVFHNEPIYVTDTFTDSRWNDLRQIAYDFNLCSCWSMPIRNEVGKPIGSFALSSFEHRAPSTFHKRLLDVGASIVNIVLAKYTQEQQLEQNRQRLIYALEHDQLTGLPNKSKLLISLRASITHQSLLLLNLDNFSFINTAYGPEFGDQFLCRVAQVLEQISPDAELFRINADEFALYFDKGVADLAAEIERIRRYFFSHPLVINGQGFSLTVTIGGASERKGVLELATQALSQARAKGKNRFHIYDAGQDEPDQTLRMEYLHWNGLLHQTFNEGRIRPFFQGIRDNRSGELVSYEALVRLEHEGQIYSPYRFLEVARLSGLLPTITRLMIDQGLAHIQDKRCLLSLNITEEDLTQEYLQDYLEQKTSQYSVAPERVVLEILEGVSASGKKNHIAQLNRLKQAGFRLAIDDFGTEYSNFERILELQVDYVKVDAKYIKNIAEDNKSYEITRAIVFFAKNAGIATVAEFVHSQAVQDVVDELGIEYSQGYLFSEPEESIP
ncbi:EAL domain-containing protein [Amphritea sp. HPY]|uniref:sensor domain-containing diguanylate cyclase n=1 Tax=Amphritea sp. HPY TaxID=3421652 RepID=UPI003D7E2553